MARPAHARPGLAAIAAVVAALLSPVPTRAAPPAPPAAGDEPEIIIVRALPPLRDRLMRSVAIGDLDLRSDAAKAELHRRVGKAVDEMCALPSPLPSYGARMTRPCRDEAWDSARPQIARAIAAAAK